MFKRWLKPPKPSFLLLGTRRTGKTTFLQTHYPEFKYITLDDFDYLTLAEADPKGLLGDTKRIIIDEAQRVPKVTIAVKHAIDQLKSQVILSGSSQLGLLDATADSLAGRIGIYHLPPACWGEELGEPEHEIFKEKANPLLIKQGQRELAKFMRYGGFPEVVTCKTGEDKEKVLKNYRNTYFTRDLAQLANIENVSGLHAILNHYGLSIGSLTQISQFRNESGLSHPTANKYVNTLYQSGLGFRLLGYQFGPAKRYLKAAKSYFCDNGIITALGLACSQGQILENFVISEIEKRRKLSFYDCEQLYYYQSIGGSEIDLVFEDQGITYATEIKSSKRPQRRDLRHLKEFISADEKRRRGVLFYTGEEYLREDKIKIIPVAALFRGK